MASISIQMCTDGWTFKLSLAELLCLRFEHCVNIGQLRADLAAPTRS